LTLVIGIPACSKQINGEMQHATPARFGDALMAVLGAVSVQLPPRGVAMLAVLDRLDGTAPATRRAGRSSKPSAAPARPIARTASAP